MVGAQASMAAADQTGPSRNVTSGAGNVGSDRRTRPSLVGSREKGRLAAPVS